MRINATGAIIASRSARWTFIFPTPGKANRRLSCIRKNAGIAAAVLTIAPARALLSSTGRSRREATGRTRPPEKYTRYRTAARKIKAFKSLIASCVYNKALEGHNGFF
jgi:hypothetical protein